jgi:hypothetical protein
MTARAVVSTIALGLVALVAPSGAQQPPPPPAPQQEPPVRPLGPITNVSRDSLESAAAAVEVAGGRVYVNDISAHRLLLFDSTLQSATVVLDSAAEGTGAYGTFPGTLLPYHGDSALFIAPQALSMLVLSPAGGVARVMAAPPSRGGIPALLGSIFGTPGFDARGRLVYFAPVFPRMVPRSPDAGAMRLEPPDSALIVRFDFASRTLDTVTAIRIPRTRSTMSRDDQGRFHIEMTAFPPMSVDDWAVTSDGAIAVVRGLDFHVEWLGPDGAWRTTPRVPYAWERLTDSGKTALLDSTMRAMQVMMDSLPARMQRAGVGGAAPSSGARGGSSGAADTARRAPGAVVIVTPRGGAAGPGGGGASVSTTLVPTATRADLSDVPDYRPAFGQGAVRADGAGNLWIRTNSLVDGRPVYDVVDRDGTLTDRVRLPPHRRIAGFGPEVVYMAVQDSTGVVHVERARVH